MEELVQGWAIITGATSGIGREYVYQLAKKKTFNLLLISRREQILNEVKAEALSLSENKIEVSIYVCDLSVYPETLTLTQFIKTTYSKITLLVNCAGKGSFGKFELSSIDQIVKIIQLNCLAPVLLSYSVIPKMVARGEGTIINVSSRNAFVSMPYLAVYAATKAFLLSFSVALCAELKTRGVLVFTQCPGATSTQFQEEAGQSASLSRFRKMRPEVIVREALVACEQHKTMIVHGIGNKFLVLCSRLLSPSFASSLVEKILRKNVGESIS